MIVNSDEKHHKNELVDNIDHIQWSIQKFKNFFDKQPILVVLLKNKVTFI